MDITLSTGVTLEACLEHPSTGLGSRKAAICLHPWSWLGGNMNDPVLSLLTKTLLATDYHVLRYNSRGTGRSSRWPSFSGLSESRDLVALLDWLINDSGIADLEQVVIAGYSHGSLIASLVEGHGSVKISYILVSYPLGPRQFLTFFHSRMYDDRIRELGADSERRLLFVYGTSDEFTGNGTYAAFVDSVKEKSSNSEFARVDGAGHFWRGRHGSSLTDIVRRWVRTSE